MEIKYRIDNTITSTVPGAAGSRDLVNRLPDVPWDDAEKMAQIAATARLDLEKEESAINEYRTAQANRREAPMLALLCDTSGLARREMILIKNRQLERTSLDYTWHVDFVGDVNEIVRRLARAVPPEDDLSADVCDVCLCLLNRLAAVKTNGGLERRAKNIFLEAAVLKSDPEAARKQLVRLGRTPGERDETTRTCLEILTDPASREEYTSRHGKKKIRVCWPAELDFFRIH